MPPPRIDTLTNLLRKALADAPSIRSVADATGTEHASLLRFVRGDQSLRLDLADRLAEHFGIESRQMNRRRKDG
jgi:plasmid maintenance system antidote protein VapI